MYINWEGSTRIVLIFNTFVIKMPRIINHGNNFYGVLMALLNGWSANRCEYLWERASIYDFLCPIKKSLFWSLVIVMNRADKITEEEFLKLNKAEFNFDGFEWKIWSFGKIDKKIVVIDYGC